MNDETMPEFKPKVPSFVINQTKENSVERYLVQELDVHGQQNQFLAAQNGRIIDRLKTGDQRMTKNEGEIERAHLRINDYETFKKELGIGWKVLYWCIGVIGAVMLVIIAGAAAGYFQEYFAHMRH